MRFGLFGNRTVFVFAPLSAFSLTALRVKVHRSVAPSEIFRLSGRAAVSGLQREDHPGHLAGGPRFLCGGSTMERSGVGCSS